MGCFIGFYFLNRDDSDKRKNEIIKKNAGSIEAQVDYSLKHLSKEINHAEKSVLDTLLPIINLNKDQTILNAQETETKILAATQEAESEILAAIKELKSTEKKKEEVAEMLQHSLNLLAENALLKERQKEYYHFFGVITQTLNDDTDFIRGNLVKGFSMDIPQVREFNTQILDFQNKILLIKETMKQQKMIENMEDELEGKEPSE